ncbi:MAG: hypothetical protein QM739_04075 [Propionivibrio sp.]
MALDERDYHSFNLPEAVKEARIRAMKDRFENALPQEKKPFEIEVPIPETRLGWFFFYAAVCIVITVVLWYVSTKLQTG